MKFKDTIKNDWRVDLGFFINILLIFIFWFCVFGEIKWICLILAYVASGAIGCLVGVVDDFGQAICFPFLLVAYYYADDEQKKIQNYLKDFDKNNHKTAVVILAYYDCYNIKYALKDNYYLREIQLIVKYLKLKYKDNFSFYFRATPDDVKGIMFDQEVREIFFVGHGDSHTFVLNLDDDIFYCDFNDVRCRKDLVQQFHCGTRTGKSLVEYVVPEDNWKDCFFPKHEVRSGDMDKFLKEKIKELSLKI